MARNATISETQAAHLRREVWNLTSIAAAARAIGVSRRTAHHAVTGQGKRWSRDILGLPPVPGNNTQRRNYAWDPASGQYVMVPVTAGVEAKR